MNKKVENANVVSETKKISEKHLTELQGHVNRINSAQLQLGQLTSQKHGVLNVYQALHT